jgi:Tfp pilus assembly protein PilZ
MPLRQSIYLTSRSETENQLLRYKLESLVRELESEQILLTFINVQPQGLLASNDSREAHAVMLSFTEWTSNDRRLVEDACRHCANSSIVVLAKRDAALAVAELGDTNGRVIFIEKPYENGDLIGIMRKLITTRAVAQRIHRRFPTNQHAQLEIAGSEKTLGSRVCNLSKGGAYIEVDSPSPPLKIGDDFRLRLQLSKINRIYLIPAKVVWMRPSANHTESGIGLEFTGPGEMSKSWQGDI